MDNRYACSSCKEEFAAEQIAYTGAVDTAFLEADGPNEYTYALLCHADFGRWRNWIIEKVTREAAKDAMRAES